MTDTQDPAYDDDNFTDIPSAAEMLQRLHAVDTQQFSIKKVVQQMQGNKIWLSVLTIPVSAVLLVIFTLIGTFAFDRPIVSFIVAAGLLFWVGKMFETQEKAIRQAARKEVMQRIAKTEGEFGLVPHFKHFLPNKYRHLWQSLRKGNTMYIEQYVQAILLLQKKIEEDKFTKIWHLQYPELAPDEDYYE